MRFVILGTLTLFLLVFAPAAPAENTALIADSNPGDLVAEGQHVYYTDGTFSVVKNSLNGVSVGFTSTTNDSWGLEFAGPDATPLQVEDYPDVVAYGTSDLPGLSVRFNSSACGEVSGDFRVLEIVYGANNEIESFHATFTQYCGEATGALTGEILYQSNDPLPPTNRITGPATAIATRNHSFTYPIFASNSPTAFTAGGLPPGLSLDATSGIISGAPTKAGTYAVALTATGASGTANGTVTITVLPAGQSFGLYTGLYLHSEDLDEILGKGNTYIFRSDNATFLPFYSTYDLRLLADSQFNQFGADLSLPFSTTLGVGTYLNATYSPLPATNPSLSVIVRNGQCSQFIGSFDIHELVTTGYDMESAHAGFLGRCDESTEAIWGEFWYKSPNAITSDLFAAVTRNQPFSYQIIGNNSPTSFSAVPLPAGLSINTATGLISGTPAISGIFRIPITATGSQTTAVSYLDLIVNKIPGETPPVVTSSLEAGGTVGEPFSYQAAAGNFNQYATSGLPPGLSINGDTGLISGTPEVAGRFIVNLLVTNIYGTSGKFLILSVYPPAPKITSAESVTAVKGHQFAFQVVATNEPSFYNATKLPIGLTIGATTGLISGAPLYAGVYIATITASNGSGMSTQSVTFTVKAIPSPSQLLNISTRLPVGTGDNVLIGGFIFQGADPKTILIRGLGPSLAAFGVPGTLSDPVLELHDSSGATIATNDNWKDTQEAAISATGIPPSSDLEPAMVATLPGGGASYTAILRGQSGGTGVGLVEVYDIDQPNESVLVNISTRGTVGTQDNVLIGGFISSGGVGNVLVRALGPSLGSAGIAGVLADPVLELHDGQGNLVGSNDNWKDSQADQIRGTTIPPSDDHESAIFTTLPAGAYTAVVQGKDNGTGIGLIEVYHLDE